MTDKDVERILADGHPIAAVLGTRGGWLAGKTSVALSIYFPADDAGPALWRLDLIEEPEAPYHSVYLKAESIVGISCRRTPEPERNQP